MDYKDENTWLMLGDCLERMKEIPDSSVDMILCDLPYGTTACKWDSVIPFEPLWEQYKRITKSNSPIVLFGVQPFTSRLVMSNPRMFKSDWTWVKDAGTGFLNAKRYPLKNTEDILVFCKGVPKYNPQMREGKPYKITRGRRSECYGKDSKDEIITDNSGERYPLTTLYFNRDKEKYHPTQKPVDLARYLIRTYSDIGDTVLDNTTGSGTFCLAAELEGRNFIGIEKDEKYFDIAKRRVLDVEGL